MTGRITKDKKAGTYYVIIEIGTKGNRKRKVIKNFKTIKEAKMTLDITIAELQSKIKHR